MDTIINKLNLETIDLLDKLIEPSEEMEKVLKDTFGLKFKGDKNWKYNAPYWILNENLKTYSSISFRNGEEDKYNSLVVVDYDVVGGKVESIKTTNYLNIRERFIPNREDSAQNILIAYLKNKLVDNGDFKMFGPKTLIHYKTDDKILVYVRPDTIHIVHDGECVIDNFSIDNFSINYFNFHPSEVDEYMLNEYLQDVLHHF